MIRYGLRSTILRTLRTRSRLINLLAKTVRPEGRKGGKPPCLLFDAWMMTSRVAAGATLCLVQPSKAVFEPLTATHGSLDARPFGGRLAKPAKLWLLISFQLLDAAAPVSGGRVETCQRSRPNQLWRPRGRGGEGKLVGER
jgi:hypothetical protein